MTTEQTGHRRRVIVFLAVLALTAALDQGTKAWARGLPVSPAGCVVPDELCRGIPQPVIAGHWYWELAANTGAAFSSLRGSRGLLVLLATLALVAMSVIAIRTPPHLRMRRVALALAAGGALGNLLDRVRDGAVIDFVRWRVAGVSWPIFNVADVALVVGMGLLLLETARPPKRSGMLAT